MQSPFPGIDPFVEAAGIWADFHLRLLTAMSDDLNAMLPDGLVARADLTVWFSDGARPRPRRAREPDVTIAGKLRKAAATRSTSVLAAPVVATLPRFEPHRQRFLKIVDMKQRRMITVIEVLSPSNKMVGEDREHYVSKRRDYLASGVNFVELDLLRQGERMPMGQPEPQPADFYALVVRGERPRKANIWPCSLREPIPDIPIPLLPGVADINLPLGRCIRGIYERARYEYGVDYHQPLKPPLSKGDEAWVRKLIADYHKKQQEPPQGVSS